VDRSIVSDVCIKPNAGTADAGAAVTRPDAKVAGRLSPDVVDC